MKDKAFFDQQTINALRIRPRMPLTFIPMHILETLKKKVLRVIKCANLVQ